MPRFFIDDITPDILTISGDDARHIAKSLRMRAGEEIILCDGCGMDACCKITDIGEDVTARVLYREKNSAESNVRVTLYMGCPKGGKLEFIVEKAVELGAVRIVPIVTSRSVSRPTGDSAKRKTERLRRHALEAAKQCGRGIVPDVGLFILFDEMIRELKDYDQILFCYEGGGQPIGGLREMTDVRNTALIIGPEGGFEPAEAQSLEKTGANTVSLGPRILRCETAAIAALSVILI